MEGIDSIVAKLGGRDFLKSCLNNNIQWLLKSHTAQKNNGSSKYRTSLGHWEKAYAETTGYLLPTLYNSSKVLSKDYNNIINGNVKYLIELHNESGAFSLSIKDKRSFVFDTSQILLGLLQLNKYSSMPNHHDVILKTYNWLISLINTDGKFNSFNYKKGYSPSYYSRILWSLLLTEKQLNLESSPKCKSLLNKIAKLKNENHSFRDCSFDGEPFAFTHNIAYTYRGLWESALLLKDSELQKNIYESILSINNDVIDKDNVLWGMYNEKWDSSSNFICCTGNAQWVVLQIEVNKIFKDNRLIKNIPILLDPLIKSQKHWNLLNRGAIPSSIPSWGKYQRFRYTNWTQKFYCDALISLINHS